MGEAAYSAHKPGYVEIDEKADFQSRVTQIREHLGLVQRQEVFDGLQLDQDLIVDDQIGAVGGFNLEAFVLDWNFHFAADRHSIGLQLL